MNTQKLEEATNNIRANGNDNIEIIADGKHADNCPLKGKGINPFLMPRYAEGPKLEDSVMFCRRCHHLVAYENIKK